MLATFLSRVMDPANLHGRDGEFTQICKIEPQVGLARNGLVNHRADLNAAGRTSERIDWLLRHAVTRAFARLARCMRR